MAEVSKTYLQDLADRARARVSSFKREQEKTISRATAIVEIWGSSFAIGWFHGRNGIMKTLFGVPYDALGAVAAYVLAFSGAAKGAEEHVLNIGHGLGAYYAGNLGAQLGQKMRKESPDWQGGKIYSEDEAKKLGGQMRVVVAGQQSPQFAPHYAPRGQYVPQQYGYAAAAY